MTRTQESLTDLLREVAAITSNGTRRKLMALALNHDDAWRALARDVLTKHHELNDAGGDHLEKMARQLGVTLISDLDDLEDDLERAEAIGDGEN